MKNLIISLFVAISFISCSATKNMSETNKKELLAYTQKFEDKGFLVVGTYLNPLYPQNSDENDEFIISVYPLNSRILEETLRINDDKEGISAYLLNDEEPILKDLAFRTPWMKHYKISAKAKSADMLILSFKATGENSQPYQVSLSFQKISKSLYWSPR